MTTSVYETTPCSRCGGTGQYSYCQTYGTTCFKCAGSGKMFTKRALKAREWLREQLAVRVGDLKVGDRIFVQGMGKFTVRDITDGGKVTSTHNGVVTETQYLTLHFQKSAYSTSPDHKVQRLPTQAQVDAAIAYQNSLKAK